MKRRLWNDDVKGEERENHVQPLCFVRLERVDVGVIGRESEAGFWVAYEFDGCERGSLGVLKYGMQPVNETVDVFFAASTAGF